MTSYSPLTVLNGATIVPITLGIYTYLGNYTTDWGAVMAVGRLRHGAGGSNAGDSTALYSQWPHRGFGGGVAVGPVSRLKESGPGAKPVGGTEGGDRCRREGSLTGFSS